MGKIKYGSHDFPASFGFTKSSGKGPVAVKHHFRKRAAPKAPKAPQKMAAGGMPTPADLMETPSAVPTLRPGKAPLGRDIGGPRTAADFQEMTRPGVAKPTAANIANAISAARSLTTPTGLMEAVIGEALNSMGAEVPGMGGLPRLEGQRAISPDLVGTIQSDNPVLGRRQLGQAAQAESAKGFGGDREARGGRGRGLGGQGSQAGDIGGEPGMGGRKAYRHGGAIARMKEGGPVTMPKVKAAVEKKVMMHNRAPGAHRNMRMPAFKGKPRIGD